MDKTFAAAKFLGLEGGFDHLFEIRRYVLDDSPSFQITDFSSVSAEARSTLREA